jgi:hypothetical protein
MKLLKGNRLKFTSDLFFSAPWNQSGFCPILTDLLGGQTRCTFGDELFKSVNISYPSWIKDGWEGRFHGGSALV